MSFRLRTEIINLSSRFISDEIKVQNNIIYVDKDGYRYKYDEGSWFIFTNEWVNLQGGIPAVTFETNVDEDILEGIEE